MDETDCDMLWNGSEEGGNVISEYREYEGIDTEGGYSNSDW